MIELTLSARGIAVPIITTHATMEAAVAELNSKRKTGVSTWAWTLKSGDHREVRGALISGPGVLLKWNWGEVRNTSRFEYNNDGRIRTFDGNIDGALTSLMELY